MAKFLLANGLFIVSFSGFFEHFLLGISHNRSLGNILWDAPFVLMRLDGCKAEEDAANLVCSDSASRLTGTSNQRDSLKALGDFFLKITAFLSR